MSAFLYYIPNIQAVTDDDIKTVGITAIDSLTSVGFCVVERGPDEGCGVVFAVAPDNEKGVLPKIGFYPKNQQWMACNHGQFWLGFELSSKPTPVDLVKTELISGHTLKLEDGNEWVIPLARAFGQGSSLPESLVLGPDGELVFEALPRFAQLSHCAERVFDVFLNEGDDLTMQDCWDIALLSLQQNYKVSSWEITVMRLLSTDNVQSVLGHLIDIPTILEAAKDEKKNQLELDSLSDGEVV